jgi:hypothetical protein
MKNFPWRSWPIWLTTAVLPLLCYVNVVEVPGQGTRYFSAMPSTVDFFVWPKLHLLIICAAGALWFLISKNTKTKSLIEIWPLALFSLLVLGSAAASKQNLEVSFWGFLESWEGGVAQLSYAMLAVYAHFQASEKAQSSRIVSASLVLGLIPIFVIALGQYFGFNLVGSELFQSIFSSQDGVGFSMAYGSGWMTSTLYHPNIVGSYVSLLAPIALASFLFARERRVIFISLAAFCCLLVLGSGAQSRAGFLGTALGCALVIIFSIFHKTFSWKTFAGIITSLVASGSLFLADSHHIRDDLLFAGTDAWSANLTNASHLVNDVRVEDDWFLLDEGECSVGLRRNAQQKSGLDISDKNHKPIPFRISGNPENGIIHLLDASCASWRLQLFKSNTIPFVRVNDGFGQLTVAFLDVGPRVIFLNNLLKPHKAKTFPLPISDTFASSRGYIWKRTLPLIFEKPWLGHGPGSFPLVFPQDDLSGKLSVVKTWNRADIVIDKPHSLFLGLAASLGIPALASLLFWWLSLGVQGVTSAFRRKNHPVSSEDAFLWGTSAGIFGYLCAGIFNDSNVCVAPLFWILCGTVSGMLVSRKKIS